MGEKIGKVLCVDDEPHVLRALRWLLQREFEVRTASSAQEGLELVRSGDFDVVVSDQRMPDVTGVEFLQQVRVAAPRAMRILLTGYADLDAMVRSVNESEVFRFITKPWDIKVLPRLIAEAARIAQADAVAAPAGGPASIAQQVTTVALHATQSMLLVDDNPSVHEAVKQACGGAVDLQHAYNLPDAVRMLTKNPVGVLVSEVQVGKLDATRLVRLMKSKHPKTVSVVFSDQTDAEAVMALINQGQVYRFIPKPLKPGFIKLVLNSALKRHRDLLESPVLQQRVSAEPVAPSAAESLMRDVQQAVAGASPASAPAAAMAGAGGGVRGLFGG